MRKGNQTILLLGMTGLGLAIAMFMDGMKQEKRKETSSPSPSSASFEEKEPSVAEPSVAEPSVAEPSDEQQEQAGPADSLPTEPQRHQAEQTPGAVDYRSLYLAEKEKNNFIEALENMQDHSYRGDGSKWSKRLYFMKEAYRRSREATPVHASAYLAAAMRDPMTFIADLDRQSIKSKSKSKSKSETKDNKTSSKEDSADDYDRKRFVETRRRLRTSRNPVQPLNSNF